jgi:selenophosphate synthase
MQDMSDGEIYATVSRMANPEAHTFIDRIIDECVADILSMTDEEIMAEAIEEFGSEEAALAVARRIREGALTPNTELRGDE